MSDRDLRNLYENVRRGDEYSTPVREEHLYERMLTSNRGDEACGNKETTIKYIDPATKEWRCARASDKWIEDILKPGLRIADSASYLDRILKHGKSTGVFDDNMTIAHPSVKLFYDWLNKSVTRGTLMQVLNTLIGSSSMQDAFINQVKGNSRFNFYELLNTTINNAVPGSKANFQLNERLSIIRPAGDEAATRGAAGPGEALLAFMYNGRPGQFVVRQRWVADVGREKYLRRGGTGNDQLAVGEAPLIESRVNINVVVTVDQGAALSI